VGGLRLCGNRSCPKCHTVQTQKWLEHRQADMLPVPHFHITVTVPEKLREVLRANQRDGYGVLMQATAPPRSSNVRAGHLVGELRPIADREVRSAVARFSAMWYNRLALKSTKRHRT
jgi:transposase-like zinc-binding protein